MSSNLPKEPIERTKPLLNSGSPFPQSLQKQRKFSKLEAVLEKQSWKVRTTDQKIKLLKEEVEYLRNKFVVLGGIALVVWICTLSSYQLRLAEQMEENVMIAVAVKGDTKQDENLCRWLFWRRRGTRRIYISRYTT